MKFLIFHFSLLPFTFFSYLCSGKGKTPLTPSLKGGLGEGLLIVNYFDVKQTKETEAALVRTRWLGAHGDGPQDNGMGG